MDSRPPLRLLVFDASCRGAGALPGLSHAWTSGAFLYRSLGRLDRAVGVESWGDALSWLASVDPGRAIGEVQFWGHGKWGSLFVGKEPLDARALAPAHRHHGPLSAVRARLSGPEALFWFRTCETFGGTAGHRFARAWTGFFGCRAAGHTFVIGALQSGLHVLSPGQAPHWPADEGIAAGTPDAPERAFGSGPGRPNTVSCMAGRIPRGF